MEEKIPELNIQKGIDPIILHSPLTWSLFAFQIPNNPSERCPLLAPHSCFYTISTPPSWESSVPLKLILLYFLPYPSPHCYQPTASSHCLFVRAGGTVALQCCASLCHRVK